MRDRPGDSGLVQAGRFQSGGPEQRKRQAGDVLFEEVEGGDEGIVEVRQQFRRGQGCPIIPSAALRNDGHGRRFLGPGARSAQAAKGGWWKSVRGKTRAARKYDP